ncbi:hypothetical protein [Mycolicibacterium hodleri]|uniref:Uncharacterized protein n=1 Tax=Mycolicibacterium hodleri TaxID=49897 RepID=A0A502EFL0_9MYCO|nr:hypothetical protein [Mycolicibacterium hodleri]TPG35772.1 hypothetical protein EAH80_06840 [Mycolicibacterium hodleri]
MTATDTKAKPHGVRVTTAMRGVELAGNGLVAAKRTRSVALIARAEGELQTAVDAARDLDVEWGRIGSALGIARGNAYQRYRRKPPINSMPGTGPRAQPRSL